MAARGCAEAVIAADPQLAAPEHALLGRPPRRAPRRDRRTPDRGLSGCALRVIAGELGGRRLLTARGDVTAADGRNACARRCSRCSGSSTGAVVLDLFAGSGALGIEALSLERGARRSSNGRRGRWSRCARTFAALSLGERARVLAATRWRHCAGMTNTIWCSLILLTPWRQGSPKRCRAICPTGSPRGALVVSESDRRAPLALTLPLRRERPLWRHDDPNPRK